MKLYVSANPHIRSGDTTRNIMLRVIFALTPALVMSVVIFGFRAFALVCVTVAACILFEYLFRWVMTRDVRKAGNAGGKPAAVSNSGSVGDLSCVVTGVLLAFNLPSTLPYYMAVIGAFVAIVITKMLFGGIGRNFANPAITARITLMLGFAGVMTKYPPPLLYFTQGGEIVRAGSAEFMTTSATPLQSIEAGGDFPGFLNMFVGFHGGVLGETCAAALIIGGVYLIAEGVISAATPLSYIGTAAVFAVIFGINPGDWVLAGGLLLGAFFMATDYATTPSTTFGKVVFGVGCGIITAVVRQFASMAEGVSFSVLIMNILTPHIEALDLKIVEIRYKKRTEKALPAAGAEK